MIIVLCVQIATNPAGTTGGSISARILTKCAKPTAPVFFHSKANSIFIKFEAQNKNGAQEV